MKPGPDLQALRDTLEDIDRRLLICLKERMELVEEVAATKIKAAFPFRDQKREDLVLRRVRQKALEMGLDPHVIERLYRLIMEMSISHQQAHVRSLETVPLRVAYQGVEGSYSHLTSQRRYAGREGGVLLTGHPSVELATEAVRSGTADVAILPIENSTAGSINETYDELARGGLCINAEIIFQVEHCLLGVPGTRLSEIRRVISHPQALMQCEPFLQSLPQARPEAEFDTAGAARKVKESGDPALAAIASESAARMLGLEVLARGIQQQEGNATRFVEVAIEAAPCTADTPCKTSLLLELDHSAGALGEVLVEIGRRNIQLSKLESRPILTAPWKYRFYLDVEAHASSEKMVGLLEKIQPFVAEVRLLGTYPKAEI
jgi:chorismate mutase/prephenate dehydratase